MADKMLPSSWIRYFASGFLIILVGSAAFYFLYVDKQKELQSHYLLRLLTTAGQNVGETIRGLHGNVMNATKAKVHPYLGSTLSNAIEDKLDLVPYLVSDSYEWQATGIATELDSVTINVSIGDEKGDYILAFSVEASIEPKKQKEEAFHVHARLSALLVPSLPADVFAGGVVIARRNEMVLLQKGGATVQLMQLPREELPGQEQTNVSPDSSITTQIRDIKIAGKKYKLFLQPFRLPLDIKWRVSTYKTVDKPPTENIWLVGGLIPSSSFRAKTMAVSPTIVLIVLCFLVVGLLCLPFLRIRFIGLREGLKAHDVRVLALALMVGCSLVTLSIIHFLNFTVERSKERNRLEAVAGSIGKRVEAELDSLECQLIRQTRMVNISPENAIKANILNDYNITYPHFEMVFGMADDGWQKWKWSIERATTSVLQLKDREYFRHAKDYDLRLPPSHQSDEDSLFMARNGFLPGRFVQSIRSKTTSEVFAILSLRRTGADTTGSIVSVIEAELLSLIDPVIPPGYGFAVIDQSGQVQFHSDKDRNLRENFFEEINPDRDVKASVFSGVSDDINITYRAEPHRAYVTPLTRTPWTLVVFTNKQILGRLDLETLTFSLAVFGFYLLVFILSCLLIHYTGQRKTNPGEAHRIIFWPYQNRLNDYRRLLVWMLLFTLFWCIGTAFSQTIMVFWCFIYPIILIGILYKILRRPTKNSNAKGKIFTIKRWQWAYIVLMAGLLVNIAILPPITFYNAIHAEEITVFTKLHQLALAGSLQNRVERHVDRFRGVKLNLTNSNSIQKSLHLSNNANPNIENAADVYALKSVVDESSNVERLPVENKSKQIFTSFLRSLPMLPTYDVMSSITRGLSDPCDTDGFHVAWSTSKNSERLIMRIQDFRPSIVLGSPQEVVSSLTQIHLRIDTPLDCLGFTHYIWFILTVTGIFLILLWIIKTITRIVFISDMKHPLSIKGEDLITEQALSRQMRIRLLTEDEEPTTDQFCIDIQDIRNANFVEELISRVKISQKTEVFLDQFDYGLDDPEISQKKLELLEGLVALKEKRILVKTSIDPLYFLTSHAHDIWAEKGEKQIPLYRWSTVLQQFIKLRWKATEGEFEKLKDAFKEDLKRAKGFNDLESEVQDSLIAEGWPNRLLKRYAIALSAREELKHYSGEDVVDQMRDMATAHYRQIWSSCSTDQKILLYRLAQEGFVNWQMKETLRSLVRRRIVVLGPNFRLMNESFRRFVLRAERPEVFQKWEMAVGASMWSRVRAPIIFFGITLFMFFFATQREVFNQSLGILAALTAGAPALIKLIGTFMQDRHTSSPQG